MRRTATAARDERADLRNEAGIVEGKHGDETAREVKQTARWSRHLKLSRFTSPMSACTIPQKS